MTESFSIEGELWQFGFNTERVWNINEVCDLIQMGPISVDCQPMLPAHTLRSEVPSLDDCNTGTESNTPNKEGTNIGSSSQRIDDATNDIGTEEGSDGSGSQRAKWTTDEKQFLVKTLLSCREQMQGSNTDNLDWDQIACTMKEKFGNLAKFKKEKLRQLNQDLRRKFKSIKRKQSDSRKKISPCNAEMAALYGEAQEGPMVEAEEEPSQFDSSMGQCIDMFNKLTGFKTIDKDEDVYYVVQIFMEDKYREAFAAMKKHHQKISWLERHVKILKERE